MQLEFIKRVEFLMDERHRIVQESLVEVLLGKLEIVASKLEKVTVTDGQDNIDLLNKSMAQMTPKRFKYAWLKESLDKAIESFEYWQRRFDPSWYLLLRIGDSQIDAALSEASGATKQLLPSTRVIRESSEEEREQEKVPVFLQSVELQALTVNKIPFSEASEAQRLNSQGSVRNMILSNIHCHPGANVVRAMRDVRDLARKLHHGDPRTFGLLDCKGVVKEVDVSKPIQSTYFTLVFRTPIGFEKPRSLRECLMSENEDNSLSDKVSIAQELAKSVNYVHVFGFVHKNIRPETVLTFSSSEGNVSSAAFLVGFDNFRNEQGQTYLRGDDAWEKNLYRHPSRQGNDPIEEYSMQHDIYSLGVCLLEIGLWVSFVSYDEKGLNPLPSAALELSLEDGGLRSPAALKDHLVALAKRRLPRCVGRKYAEVVETCLTCLDPDNTDFGDESKFLDENGILVGVRYIEKVKGVVCFNYLYLTGSRCFLIWTVSLSNLIGSRVSALTESFRNKDSICPPLQQILLLKP